MSDKCIACCGGEPMLADDKVSTLLPDVLAWSVVEVEGIKRLKIKKAGIPYRQVA